MDLRTYVSVFLTSYILIISHGGAELASKCPAGSNGMLKYEIGKAYNYNYKSTFHGVEMNFHVTTDIYGSVILQFLNECEAVMILDLKIKLIPTDDKHTAEILIPKSYTKFHIENGLMQNILFDPKEDTWMHNLKRGILTQLQSRNFGTKITKRMQIKEVSVYGNCETVYQEKIPHKVTRLTECENGEGSEIIFHGKQYEVQNVTNKNIFGFLQPAEFSECSQKIDNGLLLEVACKEISSRLKTVSQTVLKYSQVATPMTTPDLSHLTLSSTILFNFTSTYPTEMKSAAENQIKELLETLRKKSDSYSNIFIELKNMVRRAGNLEQFLQPQILTNAIEEKIFYDALVETVTDESIRVLSKLAINGKLETSTLTSFLLNIAFATNIGPMGLKSLVPLVKTIGKPLHNSTAEQMSEIAKAQHILLGISGLAHSSICRNSHLDCLKISEYQALVDEISEHISLESFQNKNLQMQEITLAALHALGNLHTLTPKATEKVQLLVSAEKSKFPDWLIVQAFEATRRDRCQEGVKAEARDNLKASARKILKDNSRTSRVRIFAYLFLARCCNANDQAEIIEVLGKSNSDDVTTFIATHLQKQRLLRKSTKLLLDIKIPDHIKPDFSIWSPQSKYLRNSYFSEKENIGFTGESTIIYGSTSRVPEFASFGATVDLFGLSFDIVEVGLSRQLDIDTQEVATKSNMEVDWSSLGEMFQSSDSYVRILGTTVAIGPETAQELFQYEVPTYDIQSTKWNFLLIDSLLNDEVVFPSAAGLPFTFDISIVKLDVLNATFNPGKGKTEMSDIMNTLFQAPYHYKTDMATQFELKLEYGQSYGGETPAASGSRYKWMANSSISLGLDVSQTSDSDIAVKLNFPTDNLTPIFSKAYDGDGFDYIEANGKFARLSRNLPHNYMPARSYCRDCTTTGLRYCSGKKDRGHYSFVSKLERQTEGLQFTIKTKPDMYEMILNTPGSPIKREIRTTVHMVAGQSNTPDKYELNVEAIHGTKKTGGVISTGYHYRHVSENIIPGIPDVTLEIKPVQPRDFSAVHFTLKQPKGESIHFHFDIDKVLIVDGHSTIKEYNTNTELKVNYLSEKLELHVTAEDTFKNPIYHHSCKAIYKDMRYKSEVTSESTVDFNVEKLSLDARSTMQRNGEVVAKSVLTGNFAPDCFNGTSKFAFKIEEKAGAISEGSLNHTNHLTETSLKSELVAEFIPPHSKPYAYIAKSIYDWSNKQPKIFDYTGHVITSQEFKGKFFVPFDLLVINDFCFHKLRGSETYHISGISNTTDMDTGRLECESGFDMNSAILENKGSLKAIVYYKPTRTFETDVQGSMNYNFQPDTGHFTQEVLFNVTENLLERKEINVVLSGNVSRSMVYIDPSNFEITETGHMTTRGGVSVDWEQDIKCRPLEFRFYQSMNTSAPSPYRGHIIERDGFTVDVSAKSIPHDHLMEINCKLNSSKYPSQFSPASLKLTFVTD